MTCSTFVWIDAQTVKACQDLGFTVHKGRGANRHYIQDTENPFNPSSDIQRIPPYAVIEVTIRATIESAIAPGRYALDEKTEMRVAAHMENQRATQGFFVKETKVTSQRLQVIDLRAPTPVRALHIFQRALCGSISPDPTYTDEVMKKFD